MEPFSDSVQASEPPAAPPTHSVFVLWVYSTCLMEATGRGKSWQQVLPFFFSLSTEEWENQGWPWVRKVYSKEKLKIRMMLRKYLWSWEEKWWLSCWTGINDHSTTDCKSLSTFHQLANSTICGKAKGAGLVWKGHSFQGVTQAKWTQCALTMTSEHPTFPSHPSYELLNWHQ